MGTATNTLLDVLDALYDASLAPHLWPSALDALARLFDARGALLFEFPAEPRPALTSPGFEAITAEYARTWWSQDSRSARMRRLPQGTGRPLSDHDLFTEAEMRRDPFYQDFLRPHGLARFMGIVVAPAPGLKVALTVERGPKRFDAADIQHFARISRHAAQAFAATTRLSVTENFANDLSAATECLAYGIITLDAEARVTYVNAAARHLLGAELAIKQGQLRAASARDQDRLDRLVAAGLSGPSLSPVASVFLTNAQGRASLLVQAVPVRRRHQQRWQEMGFKAGGLMLLVQSLSVAHAGSIVPHLQRMGLTPAQARVAELVGAGNSPREAAEELGTTEGTIRTQLKAVFSRLGLTRQTELAILVTKLRLSVRS
ncbi:MAG TPA: helix-turn-helix transcriptional regulator [Microvirga sp.]